MPIGFGTAAKVARLGAGLTKSGHGLQQNNPPNPNDVVNPIQYIDDIANIVRREKYGSPGEFEYGVDCPAHGFRLLSFPQHGGGGAMVWCHIHPGNGWKNVQPLGPPPQGWDPALGPPARMVRCCADCHPLTPPQSPHHGPVSPVGGHYQSLSGHAMPAHYSHQPTMYPAPNGSPPNTGYYSPPPPPHQQQYQSHQQYQVPVAVYPIYHHQPQAQAPYTPNPNPPHAATWQPDPNGPSGSPPSQYATPTGQQSPHDTGGMSQNQGFAGLGRSSTTPATTSRRKCWKCHTLLTPSGHCKYNCPPYSP